jgi:hypothetical protein
MLMVSLVLLLPLSIIPQSTDPKASESTTPVTATDLSSSAQTSVAPLPNMVSVEEISTEDSAIPIPTADPKGVQGATGIRGDEPTVPIIDTSDQLSPTDDPT